MDELDVVTAASLGTFVNRWYGPPDLPAGPVPGGRPGVPEALLRWYGLAARRSLPLSRDHLVVPMGDLVPGGDRVVFWRGAEDLYAYDPDGLVHEWTGAGWEPTGQLLGGFLVYVAVYEAVYAPLHGLVHVGGADLRELLDVRMVRLADPLWTWADDGRAFYADDDLLAHAGPDRTVIAGRHRDALGRFDGYPITWDWDSRRDP